MTGNNSLMPPPSLARKNSSSNLVPQSSAPLPYTCCPYTLSRQSFFSYISADLSLILSTRQSSPILFLIYVVAGSKHKSCQRTRLPRKQYRFADRVRFV